MDCLIIITYQDKQFECFLFAVGNWNDGAGPFSSSSS